MRYRSRCWSFGGFGGGGGGVVEMEDGVVGGEMSDVRCEVRFGDWGWWLHLWRGCVWIHMWPYIMGAGSSQQGLVRVSIPGMFLLGQLVATSWTRCGEYMLFRCMEEAYMSNRSMYISINSPCAYAMPKFS